MLLKSLFWILWPQLVSFSWSLSRICDFFVWWAPDSPVREAAGGRRLAVLRRLGLPGLRVGRRQPLSLLLEELSGQQTSLVECEGSRPPSPEPPPSLVWFMSLWQVQEKQGEGPVAGPCLSLTISLFSTEPGIREGRASLALSAPASKSPRCCRQSLVVCPGE